MRFGRSVAVNCGLLTTDFLYFQQPPGFVPSFLMWHPRLALAEPESLRVPTPRSAAAPNHRDVPRSPCPSTDCFASASRFGISISGFRFVDSKAHSGFVRPKKEFQTPQIPRVDPPRSPFRFRVSNLPEFANFKLPLSNSQIGTRLSHSVPPGKRRQVPGDSVASMGSRTGRIREGGALPYAGTSVVSVEDSSRRASARGRLML